MFLLQVFLGWIYGHIFEWFAHKYILHNNKTFKHHFGVHHKISRKNGMHDKNYERWIQRENLFEPISLSLILLLHAPLFFYYKYFYAALVFSVSSYYFLHRKSHVDVEWGKKWLPWHYEHHMGKNQHVNWGVRLPIIDIIFGTYVAKSKIN